VSHFHVTGISFHWSVPRAKSHLVISTCLLWVYPSSPLRTPPATSNQSNHTWLCPWAPASCILSCGQTIVGLNLPQPQGLRHLPRSCVIIWWLHNHAPPGHLIGRPGNWGSQPSFFAIYFHIIAGLILLWLICSGCVHTCSHSQFVCLFMHPCVLFASPSPSSPMWTVTIVTDTSGLQPIAYVFLWPCGSHPYK